MDLKKKTSPAPKRRQQPGEGGGQQGLPHRVQVLEPDDHAVTLAGSLTSGASIADLAASGQAGGLLIAWLGWRGVLAAVGVPGLIMGVLFLRPAAASASRAGGPAAAVSADSGAAKAAPRAVDGGRRKAGGRGGLVFFLCATALRFLTTTAVVNFMPTYLAMGRQLPPSLAAYVSGLLFAGGAAVVLWGTIADRGPPLTVLLLASGTLAPLVLVFSLPLPFWAVLPVLSKFCYNEGMDEQTSRIGDAAGLVWRTLERQERGPEPGAVEDQDGAGRRASAPGPRLAGAGGQDRLRGRRQVAEGGPEIGPPRASCSYPFSQSEKKFLKLRLPASAR